MEDRPQNEPSQRLMLDVPEKTYWQLLERAAKDRRQPKAEILVFIERCLAEDNGA